MSVTTSAAQIHEALLGRFVDEVSFFAFDGGRIARAWALEDTHRQLRRIGLPPRDGEVSPWRR